MTTVCAPATAPGRGALAVVRVTGPGVRDLLESKLGRITTDRLATLVDWKARTGETLDRAVATFFQGPRSYTGEDLLELSLHGNPLLVRQVLEDLHRHGIGLAAPGEFTRRAVENGKLDLSRAESVGAIVAAETEDALEASRRILSGGLQARIRPLRAALVSLSARLELEVDFAEEEAAPGGEDLLPWLDRAREELSRMLQAQDRLQARGHAPRAVLAGAPNAGKSSLANALLGEDRLLVSPVAGTTRDWVEVPVHTRLGTVILVDTAGLGLPSDGLDAMAQIHTRRALAQARLRVLVVEAGRDLSPEEIALSGDGLSVVVRTKMDLFRNWAPREGEFPVSATAAEGLEPLRERLSQLLAGDRLGPEEISLVGQRQRQAAQSALGSLAQTADRILAQEPEIAAWHARQALSALADLVGEVPPDEVLGAVFSSFCIGK
ncbi:MAG TPA: GTPase [Fibrobacteria bacterium]|nr:GTPase [Fibrobacteria bacterium]